MRKLFVCVEGKAKRREDITCVPEDRARGAGSHQRRAKLQDVISGKLDPSPVLDMTVDLDGVPAGYAAMDNREAIKVMVRPWRQSANSWMM